MAYELHFSRMAADTLNRLMTGGPATAAKLRKVRKALALLECDPQYPGLRSHRYQNFPGIEKEKVWDSYIENRTPGAWRIYWMYGPNEERDGEEISVVTVLAIGTYL